jgi:hypothetical protein
MRHYSNEMHSLFRRTAGPEFSWGEQQAKALEIVSAAQAEVERLRNRIDQSTRFWIEATQIAIQKGDFRPLNLRVDASRTPFQATETD